MHFADLTMFFARESGGVRRYLNAKHRWINFQTLYQHSLLTPGNRAAQSDPGHYLIPSPPLPLSHGYRFPLRRKPWTQKLLSLKPDLIEAGDPYVTAWAALDAGQQLGVPTLAFYHSDLPRALMNRMGTPGLRLANRYVSTLYREFDLVLAPSRVMVENLSSLGIHSVSLQPLGVDIEMFHPDKRASEVLRRQQGIPFDAKLLIFAGRFAREKNIPVLFDVMRILGPKYFLLLAGPEMPESGLANIRTLNQFIDEKTLARMLASADALIHAGAEETFGLIVLEAMASGLPVVGINSGGVGEIVQPDTGVLADPGCNSCLAEAVTTLFSSDYRTAGRAARAAVELHWSWDMSFTTLMQTYGAVTGKPLLSQPALTHAAG